MAPYIDAADAGSRLVFFPVIPPQMPNRDVASLRRLTKGLSAGLLSGLVAVAPLPAQTIITSFGSRADFDAVTTNRVQYGFDGLAPSNSFVTISTISTIGSATLSGTRTMFVVGENYQPAGFPDAFKYGTGPVFTPQGGAPLGSLGQTIFKLTFAVPVTAFGVDYSSYDLGTNGGIGTAFTFTLDNGLGFTRTQTVERPTFGFFGVTYRGGGSLASITVSGLAAAPVFDNFTIGTRVSTSTVPEPVPSVLVASALVFVAGVRLRRRTP